MSVQPEDLPDILQERRQTQRVVDDWGALSPTYMGWHEEYNIVQEIYNGNWDVVWPDNVVERSLPKIPNYVQIAADDRSRQVTATRPSITCRPSKPGERAKQAAESRERMLRAWWDGSRVQSRLIPRWAFDAMGAGLTVCQVLPDFKLPPSERAPIYERLDPGLCFPNPVFTEGPFVDNMLFAYQDKITTIYKEFGLADSERLVLRGEMNADIGRVLKWYDDEWMIAVLETIPRSGFSSAGKQHQVLARERHGLGRTPVTIGSRATMDGTYRGEFMGGLGILNVANRLVTMMIDDAANKVYPQKLYVDVENPEDNGPDALLEGTSPNARFEYVQPSNQAFTNMQIQRDLLSGAAAATMMPPSRLGDPNESIISAAGISASQGQFVEDVKAIQRDIIAPMMQAANEIALRAEEVYGGRKAKSIYVEDKGSVVELTYKPQDIDGQYRNSVIYGLGAGLDQINTNVMVLQQRGAGLMSKMTAMEQSPFTEDPLREEKQMALEALDEATFAGLVAQAQQGLLPAAALAAIKKAVVEDGTSLHDAIAAAVPQAPLASPQGTSPGASTVPGLAGAAVGGATPATQQNEQSRNNIQAALPPLASLGVRR